MKLFFVFFILVSVQSVAQVGIRPLPYIETINNAAQEGITIGRLDSIYESAIHIETAKAVFKTKKEQDSLVKSYTDFLQQLGKYLKDNNFKWGKPTRCWNRIYFRADGKVDYYLFDFKTDISPEKVARYKELFRAFAATHRIKISARVKFAQCSPVTFKDE